VWVCCNQDKMRVGVSARTQSQASRKKTIWLGPRLEWRVWRRWRHLHLLKVTQPKLDHEPILQIRRHL
jgi:hypothetical protein